MNCQALTTRGKPCQRITKSKYCWQHQDYKLKKLNNTNKISSDINRVNKSIITSDIDKKDIIDRFNKFVRGKVIDVHTNHDGGIGHWLEKQMGISHNSKNEPDINGYEMKKDSKKITFGDFSASEYLFTKNKKRLTLDMSRDNFIKYFGNKNSKKHNRWSWSGSCVPKYGEYNECGQKLDIDDENNIIALYNYKYDKRNHDVKYPELMNGDIEIAIWLVDKMKKHIEQKFNSKGFFICYKSNNIFNKICFGKPFNFQYFIENIKNGNIIFDSGMYLGNNRNYSQFRASSKSFWSQLIIEEF